MVSTINVATSSPQGVQRQLHLRRIGLRSYGSRVMQSLKVVILFSMTYKKSAHNNKKTKYLHDAYNKTKHLAEGERDR